MPNWTQISGVLDRALLVGLTWLASKGYINNADVAGYATLLIGIAGSAYAFWVNRNSNLANRASSIPGTTVVTTPEIAASLPQANVVSNLDKRVVNK